MADILVVDDERSICLAFEQLLAGSGHECRTAYSASAGLSAVVSRQPDIIFLDVRLPDANGIELFGRFQQIVPAAKVVIMTAFGSVGVVADAMKMGAFDYLPKPLNLPQIRKVLGRAVTELGGCGRVSLDELPTSEGTIVGQSAAIQEVFKLIGIVSLSDVTVLIEGESGVGKELVARAIHDLSERKDHPFLPINCAAIPPGLLESELFGHERGAFTGAVKSRAGRFAVAGSGTVFLDEIGDMPLGLQTKVLRCLQEKTIERVGSSEPTALNARIIAATHHDLKEDIAAGRFREDLLYRLKVVSIRIPPLRERREDIPILAAHFIRESNRELGSHIKFVEQAALEELSARPWPGNVRELENVLRSACVLARSDTLLKVDIEETRAHSEVLPGSPAALVEGQVKEVLSACLDQEESTGEDLYWRLIKAAERGALQAALEAANGNQVAAARRLGIGRGTLRRKIEEYGLRGTDTGRTAEI